MVIHSSLDLAAQLEQLCTDNWRTQGYRYKKKSAANMVSGFCQFLYFTAHFQLRPVPANEITLTLFLEFMARTVKYGHLKHLLRSVTYVHEALNLDCPNETFQVQTTLKGLKRRLAKVPFQVLPLSPSILRKIYSYLDMNNAADLALWCSYLTAFYGLLRKKSTVPETSDLSEEPYLKKRHLQVDRRNNMVYIYIGYSKTNNFCTRDIVIPVPGNNDAALDLVRHLTALYDRVNSSEDSPAFTFKANQFISYTSFTSRLKTLLRKAGLNPDLFSGHSFRRGGATFLYNCGGSTVMIQASGDWSSQCFTRYLYLTEGQRLAAQLLMRNAIHTTI